MKKSIFIILLGLALFSCNSNPKTETKKTSPTTVNAAANIDGLLPLPEKDVKILWERCDYLDYLFYNTNFTLSQDDQASIRQFLTFLSSEPSKTNSECESLGRVFFQEKGEILYEAEFHFKKGCTHLIFLKNNKPIYKNELTPQGIQFFMNLFKKAQSGDY